MTSKEAKIIAIGLGANLEDPAGQIKTALKRIGKIPGLTPLAAASLYLTEPQAGPEGQSWYHNTVAAYECSRPAREIMDGLLAIETSMGRVRVERWGPRIIDLDIILFGDEIINEPPHLLVPHPRMGQRRFVLAPLAEILPQWRHPESGLTVTEMLAALPAEGQEIMKAPA